MSTVLDQRRKTYKEDHCWQYDMRLKNEDEDLRELGLTKAEASQLVLNDFEFSYVPSDDKEQCREIKQFIEKHEWLGNIPNRPTHRFTARLKGYGDLAGVIIMAVPNAFTNILGPENKEKEKLIARGACISWSPKNMASWIIMKSINWMVVNTEFRYFSAYSDPEALELGTVYQATNWIYLGQTNGTSHQYRDPARDDNKWFSGREFRKRSAYNRYAKTLGIYDEDWKTYYYPTKIDGKNIWTPLWDRMPPGMKERIKAEEKRYRESCEEKPVGVKHKYIYIKGANKKETKTLKARFKELNPKLTGNTAVGLGLPYPKDRGEGRVTS